jgi:hypothetical protein
MNENHHDALTEMLSQYLQALRQREREVVQYVAILLPALGGFLWLIKDHSAAYMTDTAYVVGSVSVLFLFLVGAVYSRALGYSYRCVVMQLAKLRSRLNLSEYVIARWPRRPEDFEKRLGPPEIVNVFWLAFMVALVGVVSGVIVVRPTCAVWAPVSLFGLVFIGVALFYACHFRAKLAKAYAEERDQDWGPLRDRSGS